MEILYLLVVALLVGFMSKLGVELNKILLAPMYRNIHSKVNNISIKYGTRKIESKPYKETKMGFCTTTIK